MFDGTEFEGLPTPTETLNAVAKTGYTNLEPTSAIVDNLARMRIHANITNNKDGFPYAVQALAMYWDVEPKLEDGHLVMGDYLRAPLDQFGDIYIDFPALILARST